MQAEIEAKFLDIDPDKIRAVLKECGADFMHPERLMKRRNFDYPDGRLQKIGGWVRVRDEGDKVTLAYKRVIDFKAVDGTKEISIVVDDFDKTRNLLLAIGFDCTSYQETKREKWVLDGVEVTIDTWPWIPTFVELEGESEELIKNAAAKLGLNWAKALHGSVEIAYKSYYDVTDEEIDSWESITFIPVPDWLEIRGK